MMILINILRNIVKKLMSILLTYDSRNQGDVICITADLYRHHKIVENQHIAVLNHL